MGETCRRLWSPERGNYVVKLFTFNMEIACLCLLPLIGFRLPQYLNNKIYHPEDDNKNRAWTREIIYRILKRFDRVRACHNLIAFEESVTKWCCENVAGFVRKRHFTATQMAESNEVDITSLLTSEFGRGHCQDVDLPSKSQLRDIIEMQKGA